MKKIMLEFMRRGVSACALGPLVLAVLYLILDHQGVLQPLTASSVCMGIFSLTGLAFVAGGMNVLYQIERLPLLLAVLIHGIVLYLAYLATYLLNGWLKGGNVAILVFSAIFAVGYIVIWVVISSVVRRRTDRINEFLREKQQEK